MSVGERLGRWSRAVALCGLVACDNSLGAPCGRHSDCASGYCDPTLTCAAAPDAPVGVDDAAAPPRDAPTADAAPDAIAPDGMIDGGDLDAGEDAGAADAGAADAGAADAGLDAL